MTTNIWCMFSVENEYSQPRHNLVRWWGTQPSLEQVAHAMGVDFPSKDDETTLKVVKAWQGGTVEIHSTDYRLEAIPEGSAWKP